MDGQKFDQLTRLLAEGTSRRRVLRGIAGGAFGLFAARSLGPQGAEAQACVTPGGTCTTTEQCCQGTCSDAGVCFCEIPEEPVRGCTCQTADGTTCFGSSALCCPTATAGAGICTSPSTGCNPTGCANPGAVCTEDSDCCQGTCSDAGVCFCDNPGEPVLGCDCETANGTNCFGSTALCCPTDSGAGICVSGSVGCNPTGCANPGAACTDDGDCCQGTCSDAGVCFCEIPLEPVRGCDCLTAAGTTCFGTTELCCPTATAGAGICTSPSLGCNPTGCANPGAVCTEDSDCCQGTCSDAGVCFCENPGEPVLGCDCLTSAGTTCFGSTALCCPTETAGAGICVSGSVGCNPRPCPDVTCDPTAVLNEETCECECDGPQVMCDSGACLHCGAIFQVDLASCTCICPGTEACPCEGHDQCEGDLVCCFDGVGLSCRESCGGVCAIQGEDCTDDNDCCQGSCSDEGICYCLDPARPSIGCSCEPSAAHSCRDTSLVCCATSSTPGVPGICTSESVGCDPVGDDCVTGDDDACADGFECCALPNTLPGGPGICIPTGTQCAHQGCQPAGFACIYDSECCVGICGDGGYCFCEDPADPARDCPCDPAVAHVCGDDHTCCANSAHPVCVPNKVGCPGGGGTTPPPAKPPVTTPAPAPVATLPSTGAGTAGDENASWLTPAALAGAAIVAGRLLRRTPEAKPDTTEE